jgi:hypothetical protein
VKKSKILDEGGLSLIYNFKSFGEKAIIKSNLGNILKNEILRFYKSENLKKKSIN